jgi:hypothetical protein
LKVPITWFKNALRSFFQTISVPKSQAASPFRRYFASNGGTAITSACKSFNALFESGEVLRTGKNGEIRIAAKFGCAVEHACLAAH